METIRKIVLAAANESYGSLNGFSEGFHGNPTKKMLRLKLGLESYGSLFGCSKDVHGNLSKKMLQLKLEAIRKKLRLKPGS